MFRVGKTKVQTAVKKSSSRQPWRGETHFLSRPSRQGDWERIPVTGEGRLSRLMTTLERTNLIIIDDWGPEPLTADQRRDLLEIVDDRYDKGSLLITSQVPVAQWHDVIADPTLGDAILDRIIHNAHRIELKGDSLRRRAGEKKAA
jgi:DNA replication protein DnaC